MNEMQNMREYINDYYSSKMIFEVNDALLRQKFEHHMSIEYPEYSWKCDDFNESDILKGIDLVINGISDSDKKLKIVFYMGIATFTMEEFDL